MTLCACAAGPTIAPTPRVTPPLAYDGAPGNRTLAVEALDRWWLLFNDPDLNALEDEAFRYSPDARTAQARLLEARATRNSQTLQTLPQGGIDAKASHEPAYQLNGVGNNIVSSTGVTNEQQVNFDISWEIDLFGRLKEARRVANADLLEARFNTEAALASLAASVADQYFLARGLAIQLADAKETVRIQSELQDVAARKAALGLGAASDADRVAGDLAQAKSQVENLQAQLHAAQRQLLILVGRPFEPVVDLRLNPEPQTPPPIPSAIPGDLMIRRPDVREADARLRAQAGTARLRHLAIFPTLTLLPGLGASNITSPGVGFIPPATLISQPQTTALGFWSLAVNLQVPVLDIPHLLQDAKAEDARTTQAAIAYEKTVQTAYGEAENALVNLAAAERAAQVLNDGEVRAHRSSDAAQRRYRMGLDDITSTLSAEESWRTTRSTLTSARIAALRQAVAAYKALGGGWAYTTTNLGAG
jgi:NodT family efflux transporter outer membrane factor (OMF) lipoprotein